MAKNLLAIINDVLDLSKIEAGQLMLKRARVDTRELISGVIESLRPAATQKRLALNFNRDGHIPDLWVDELRARQILTNILSNAIKFTTEGSISVQIRPADDRFLQISVADTGIGIPKDALEAIFDEFHQVDNSSTREYEGTGLGLTISRRLASMHGGQITAESELGKGSTFHIILPVAREM